MEIKRLLILETALSKAFEELDNDSGNLLEEEDIFMHIGNVTSWISQIDEWHSKKSGQKYFSKKQQENLTGLISGIRHVFNMYKHDMNFVTLNKMESGASFPLSFPFRLIHWEWANIEDLNTKYEGQKRNYIKYLQGNDIKSTLKQTIDFLLEEGKKYK